MVIGVKCYLMEEIGITIVGAGVIGLAVAAGLSKRREGILVLERNENFGQETSSRNSEVIHAGIYYSPGTMKARLCVEGRDMLYEFCRRRSVPYSKTGKLIVATDQAKTAKLHDLCDRAGKNGAGALSVLGKKDVSRIEPAVRAESAILSPETGIIDSHSLMKKLYEEARSAGVIFSFNSSVNMLKKEKDGWIVGVEGEDCRFKSMMVINAAGLSSDKVAALAGIDVDKANYRLCYLKGSYFSYAGAPPVGRLVYPLPEEDLVGLGIHATLDLGGRLRFGPDAVEVDEIDYRVDAGMRNSFYERAGRIIKGLNRESFSPDMAGIRPRAGGGGEGDFVIRHESDRGLEGLINLVGIESPGLTASLAISREVYKMVADYL